MTELDASNKSGASNVGAHTDAIQNLPPARTYTWVGPVVSMAVLVGFFAMLYVLLTKNSFESMKEIENVLFTLLGALGAAFTQVVNYWLGSSKGSADKTTMLATQRSAQ